MRVSVITAAWNASWCVARAMTSALGQTAPPHEVILADDGSTDGTPELVERQFGDRVRVLRLPHGNASAARVAAVEAATGDWLALLDADDVWYPHKLARQQAWLEAHPEVRMLTSDGRHAGEDVMLRDSWLAGYFDPPREVAGNLLPALIERCFPLTSATLIERAAYDAVGGFDPTLAHSHDYELWLKLAARYPLGIMTDVLIDYWSSPSQLSRRIEGRWRDNLVVMQRVACGVIPVPAPVRRRARERAAALAFDVAVADLRAGRVEDARAQLRRAMGNGPWRRRVIAGAGAVLPRLWTRRLMRTPWAKQAVAEARRETMPMLPAQEVGS